MPNSSSHQPTPPVPSPTPSRPLRWLFVGLQRVLLLLCLLPTVWWLWQHDAQAPKKQYMQRASVHVPVGHSINMGRLNLAAKQAETNHVRISRDAHGAWFAQNISHGRAVELSYTKQDKTHDVLLRSITLQPQYVVSIGKASWRVQATKPRLVLVPIYKNTTFATAAGFWFDGAFSGRATSTSQAPAQASCPDASATQRVQHGWNKLVPTGLQRSSRLYLGGHADCGNYIRLPTMAVGDVWVRRIQGQYVLFAKTAASRKVCVLTDATSSTNAYAPCPTPYFLYNRVAPLKHASHMVLGRTQFALNFKGDTLHFTPTWRGGLLPASAQANAEVLQANQAQGVRWKLAAFDAWALPHYGLHHHLQWLVDTATSYLGAWAWAAAAAVVLILLISLAWVLRRVFAAHAKKASWLAALGCIVGGAGMAVCALLFATQTVGLGVAWYVLMFVCASASLMLLPIPQNSWWWIVLTTIAMMCVGLVVQFALAMGATDTGSWSYVKKMAAANGLACWALLVAACVRALHQMRQVFIAPWQSVGVSAWRLYWREYAIWAISLLALLLLALQTWFGNEQGVLGMQPVELAKFALVMATAQVLALRLEASQQYSSWQRNITIWLTAAMPLALLLGLITLALGLLKDYSPLVLLLAWGLGMLLAWSIASQHWLGLIASLAGAAGVVGLWYWLHGDGINWLIQHGFYPDRFMVWLDMPSHPHSAYQFTKASRLISAGGWAGNAASNGWEVPAVQYDFTPAFVIGKFGKQAACALMALQACWLLAVFNWGYKNLTSPCAGGYMARWHTRLVYFACMGMGFLFAGHFVVSWGTNLGWLPVMGQPMPLVAAGSSLVLGLVLPFLGVAVSGVERHFTGKV